MIEFLNPFIWALSFSLVPLFIYFYKFYTRKRYVFPTLKFVYHDEKTKLLNVNVDLLKLFLKMLIIATIVFIFSSPVVKSKKVNGVVFYVDNSYSSRFNFDDYISYIKKALREYTSDMKVFVFDNSGNLISGTPQEVIQKLRYYNPGIGRYILNSRNTGAFSTGAFSTSALSTSALSTYFEKVLRGYRIIFLTDGQRSFWNFVKSLGIDEYESVVFPSFSLDAKAYIRVWNRVSRDVEGEVEVYSSSNCSVSIVLSNLASGVEKVIMSSQVAGRKSFFIKFSNPFDEVSVLKVLLSRERATNEFFVPVVSIGGISLNVPESYKKLFVSSFYSLGFSNLVSGSSFLSVNVLDTGNISVFRNSLIIPKSENARFLYRGKFIVFNTNSFDSFSKSINYSFHSLPIATRLYPSSVPEGGVVVKSDGAFVGVYLEEENNFLVLGDLNLYDTSLPIFLKEVFEFLLVDSKFLTNTDLYNYEGTFSMLPEEEISDVELMKEEKSKVSGKFNFVSLLLFVFLCVFMVVERYI